MKLFKQKETYISEKVCIYGNIETDADISVDGEVYGNIVSKKSVMLGLSAHFEGDIECETALVCGHFIGTITAKRLIEVKIPACVVGDLIADSVCLNSGVAIQGKILAKTLQKDHPAGESPASRSVHRSDFSEAERVPNAE